MQAGRRWEWECEREHDHRHMSAEAAQEAPRPRAKPLVDTRTAARSRVGTHMSPLGIGAMLALEACQQALVGVVAH